MLLIETYSVVPTMLNASPRNHVLNVYFLLPVFLATSRSLVILLYGRLPLSLRICELRIMAR